jgi:hypothetical protein
MSAMLSIRAILLTAAFTASTPALAANLLHCRDAISLFRQNGTLQRDEYSKLQGSL